MCVSASTKTEEQGCVCMCVYVGWRGVERERGLFNTNILSLSRSVLSHDDVNVP